MIVGEEAVAVAGSHRDPRRHTGVPGRGAILAALCRDSAATEQRHDDGRARHWAAYVLRLVTVTHRRCQSFL